MKKFKSLLIAVAALAAASMFTSCAAALKAVASAVVGNNQTIKVTSSKETWNTKKVTFLAVEVTDDGNGGYTETATEKNIECFVNGSSDKISDKLETVHAYRIYVLALGNNIVYTARERDQIPTVKKAADADSCVTAKGTDKDVIIIAGDVDYEIVLTYDSVSGDVVAKLKGTRQASN